MLIHTYTHTYIPHPNENSQIQFGTINGLRFNTIYMKKKNANGYETPHQTKQNGKEENSGRTICSRKIICCPFVGCGFFLSSFIFHIVSFFR